MAGAPLVAAMSPYTAPVHINVGGTTYTSCLETLTKFPHSKLAKLFNGTLPVAVDPVKQRYFLDRDGKMFRHILNFLRNSEIVLPDTFSEFDLLQREAAYFEIEDFIKALEDNRQSDNGKVEPVKHSKDDNTKGSCKPKLQGRDRERKKEWNKQNVKDKKVNYMLEVLAESEFAEEQEADLKKKTLKGNRSSATLVGAKSRLTDKKTNVRGMSQVPDASDALQVHSSVEEVVVDKELVCVVTNDKGGVKELWCSDKNFQLEIPESLFGNSKLYACSPSTYGFFMMAQLISIPFAYNANYAIGFPWIATYLFKQGYRLTTSSGRDKLYNFFVK